MDNNNLYLCSFIIALCILYLIIIDLKKFKIKLFNEINKKIWIKIYALLCIVIIHLIWLMSILFTHTGNTFALPAILIIPYIIFLVSDLVKTELKDSIASNKINKYLNYLISIYFVIIIMYLVGYLYLKK